MKDDFEGLLLLEQLAPLGLVDEFFEAIDSDDIKTVVKMILNA